MKSKQTIKLLRGAAVFAGLLGLALNAPAAPFIYNSGNLLLGIRKSGSADLVVNIGLGSTFSALSSGSTLNITTLTPGQLNGTYADLNDLTWSVSGSIYPFDTNGFPSRTLWVTRARTDINVQSSPWFRFSTFAQAGTAAQISALGNGAATYSNGQAAGTNNTVTGVVIPAGNGNSYTTFNGSGNWGDFFQGNVENTTASDFIDDENNLSRVDLYELQPGSGEGVYLGFFDLKADGTLTYTAGPSEVVTVPPVITGVTRVGTTTTVSFTTINGLTYRLRSVDATGLANPVSGWTAGGSTVAGDGSVKSLPDTTSNPHRYYKVEAF